MGGGKGGGGAPDLMLPQPQSDNSDLYMAMMEQQNQQNQQMMQMIAQMMVAGQDSSNQPVIVMPDGGGSGSSPYQSVDFSGTRDQLHDKATQNVSDEASNRTGRSKTIVSSPRLDQSAPATTGSKGQTTQNKSLLSSDDTDDSDTK